MAKRQRNLKPLRLFDYKLVAEKVDGLLVNVDRDLQRKGNSAEAAKDFEEARCLGLLNLMARFAKNSYDAVKYLVLDAPGRKPNYMLVIVPMNRQLLDLLFTLVYMVDDFPARSIQYQRAGWREKREEYQKFNTEFAGAPEWRAFLAGLKRELARTAPALGITKEEKNNLKLIPYWKHPGELKDEPAAGKSFLRWLDKWLYADTSAQAHLSCGGLFMIAPFLAAEMVGGQYQEIIEDRLIHQYQFIHFSRAALITLAIATEVDCYCNLGNNKALSYLWTVFSEYAVEGREMYERRYQAMLQSVTDGLIRSLRGRCKGEYSLAQAHEIEHRIER